MYISEKVHGDDGDDGYDDYMCYIVVNYPLSKIFTDEDIDNEGLIGNDNNKLLLYKKKSF